MSVEGNDLQVCQIAFEGRLDMKKLMLPIEVRVYGQTDCRHSIMTN